MMELCLQNDCPSSEDLYRHTMKNKNKEVALNAFKWLRQKNIPWYEGTCAAAAAYGNPDALKWARENGCQWDIYTLKCAMETRDMSILAYCFEHDCPYDSSLYLASFVHKTEYDSLKLC